jgi:intracellular sulfur oxidation DsrE/DsrF family protein
MASKYPSEPSIEHQYFYEDEVFHIDKKKNKIKFGLIIENYENLSEEFDDALKKGEIRVVWHPEGREQIVKESAVS